MSSGNTCHLCVLRLFRIAVFLLLSLFWTNRHDYHHNHNINHQPQRRFTTTATTFTSHLATVASPPFLPRCGYRCWTRAGRTLNSVYKITDFVLQKRIKNDTRPLFAVQSVSEGRFGPASRTIDICKFVDQKAFTPTFSRANGERGERSKGGGQRRSYGGIKGPCSSVRAVWKSGARSLQ